MNQGFFTLHPFFQIHQNSINDHNGIVNQHAHGYNKSPQGNPLQGSTGRQQDGKSRQNGQQQPRSNDYTTAKTHKNHQYHNNDQHRCHQIPHKPINSAFHQTGLKEDFVKGVANRYILFQFFKPFFHPLAHFNNIFTRFHGERNGQCIFVVQVHVIA